MSSRASPTSESSNSIVEETLSPEEIVEQGVRTTAVVQPVPADVGGDAAVIPAAGGAGQLWLSAAGGGGVEPPAPSSHALDGLASMGFPRALCEAALRKSRGNADAAAELLFNGYSGEPEPAPVSAVPGAKDGNDGHDWRCEECTFLNIRWYSNRCNMCDGVRPAHTYPLPDQIFSMKSMEDQFTFAPPSASATESAFPETVTFEGLSSTQRRVALVTFWNMSSPSTRAAALATLVTMVRSSEGDGSSTGEAPGSYAFESGAKMFDGDESLLTELPMEFLSDVEVPASWYDYYLSQAGPEQVKLLQGGWLACSLSDQRMILADMEHFYRMRF